MDCWTFNKELATSSDYELIVSYMTNLNETVGSKDTREEATSWGKKTMSEEETKEVQKAWQEHTAGRESLWDDYNTEEGEKGAIWVETSLMDVLNSHSSPLGVTSCSKRWWIPEVKDKYKEHG